MKQSGPVPFNLGLFVVMFLLRSAFWLTVAFVVIGPKDIDLGATATDLTAQAVSAGQQVIVTQVLSEDCKTIECVGSKAIVAAAISSSIPSPDLAMHGSSDNNPVPLPRPRPDRMG